MSLFFSVSTDSPQIVHHPAHTAAFKGSDARFNCTAALLGHADAVMWSYIPLDDVIEQRIYNSIDGESVCCEFAGRCFTVIVHGSCTISITSRYAYTVCRSTVRKFLTYRHLSGVCRRS